jgi:hypothetical protein
MSSPPRHRSAVCEHGSEGVELPIQRSHLGAFLFGWHWDIGDVYIHSGLVPSMQLCGAAYHVFESRRDVDHFIALAFCKANAGFSSRVPPSCSMDVLGVNAPRLQWITIPSRAWRRSRLGPRYRSTSGCWTRPRSWGGRRRSGRLEKTGKEIVELAADQIANFAANAIELLNEGEEKLLVLSSRADRVLTHDQRKRLSCYARLVPLELPTIELGGGSARCMIADDSPAGAAVARLRQHFAE